MTKFSPKRTREIAAIVSLLNEIPDSRIGLLTKVATVLACDGMGSKKIEDVIEEIIRIG